MELNIIDSLNSVGMIEKRQIALFLHQHLGNYSEPVDTILKAMDYALQETSVNGGFILTMNQENELIGAAVLNRTGMDSYVPPNMLVYIAVHEKYRGRGVGSKLLQKSIDITRGEIKLHVDPQNPVKQLIEKFGFTHKYIEYRLKR